MIDLAEMKRLKRVGRRYVQLVVTRKTKPRTRRVRVIPGCLGVCVGQTQGENQYIVDVLLDDLIPALEKRREG